MIDIQLIEKKKTLIYLVVHCYLSKYSVHEYFQYQWYIHLHLLYLIHRYPRVLPLHPLLLLLVADLLSPRSQYNLQDEQVLNICDEFQSKIRYMILLTSENINKHNLYVLEGLAVLQLLI